MRSAGPRVATASRQVLRQLLMAVLLAGGIAARGDTLIDLENARTGTESWQPTRPARNHEIEGYASKTSIDRGEQIELFVHTTEPAYTLEVYRMGWYGGAGRGASPARSSSREPYNRC